MRRLRAVATLGLLFAACLGAPRRATAQSDEGAPVARTWEVTPFAGYQWGGGLSVEGGELSIPSGPSYGAIVGMRVRSDAVAEFVYNREQTTLSFRPDSTGRTEDLADLAVQYFQLGGTVDLGTSRARPFVSGLLGLTWFDPTDGYSGTTRFSGGLGIGVHPPLSRKVGLRLEAKGWLNFFNGSGSIFCGSGGCIVQGSASAMGQGEVVGGLSVEL
jgi:hypothetical protein